MEFDHRPVVLTSKDPNDLEEPRSLAREDDASASGTSRRTRGRWRSLAVLGTVAVVCVATMSCAAGPAAVSQWGPRRLQAAILDMIFGPPLPSNTTAAPTTQPLGPFVADVVRTKSVADMPTKIVTGVALCGGGARAFSAAFGQIKALVQLGIMNKIDGLSTVSGGTWAGSIYMFADMPLDKLLGNATDPRKLDMAAVRADPPPFGKTITQALNDKFPNYRGPGFSWNSFTGKSFLEPFGLFDQFTANTPMGSYMAASEQHRASIIERNPQLKDAKFLIPRPDRPKAFVMNCVLLPPQGSAPTVNNSLLFQVSPDWSGVPFYPDGGPVSMPSSSPECDASTSGNCTPRCRYVGGGLIETFAFGGAPPAQAGQYGGKNVSVPAPPVPLELGQAVTLSSFAYAAAFAYVPGNPMTPQVMPKHQYWPVADKGAEPAPGCTFDAESYYFGDGAYVDNTGVIGLLQRGATKIAQFVNTDVQIDSFDWCASDALNKSMADGFNPRLDSSFKALFGFKVVESGGAIDTRKNQVFPKDKLQPVVCELQTRKKQGKPAVSRMMLPVVANPWYGIAGGQTVDCINYYLDVTSDFEALLPNDTQAEISLGRWNRTGDLKKFPNYPTGFNNGSQVNQLPAPQVNLLAAQAEYAVMSSADLFLSVLATTTVTTTTAGGTTSAATTSAGATTSIAPVAGSRVLTGQVTLTVENPASFVSDPAAKASVAQGIATTIGVNASYVVVTLTAARRLEAGDGWRRLAGGVSVSYVVTVPPSVTFNASTATSQLSSGNIAALATNVQQALAQRGVSGSVAVASVTAPTTTTTGGTTTGSMSTSHAAGIVTAGHKTAFGAAAVGMLLVIGA